jgi:HEAT repeat protein
LYAGRRIAFGGAVGLALALMGGRAHAYGRIEELAMVLRQDPSYKVRLEAAMALGKLHDRRAVPALIQSVSDEREHYAVRGMAAQALGLIGDPQARDTLERAARSANNFIRDRAKIALRELLQEPPPDAIESRNRATGEKIFLAVGRMGDKTGHAPAELRDRMRDYVLGQLKSTPYVTLNGPASKARGFIVDGAIKEIAVRQQRDYVEASCEVELVISVYPTHSIVMMTTGEAAVQTPRMHFRPQNQDGMERDALENAVKGAHANLVQFLQAQR